MKKALVAIYRIGWVNTSADKPMADLGACVQRKEQSIQLKNYNAFKNH